MHPPMDGEECVWKRLPDGFVLKMLKALYGLKQAGRTWYDTIHDAFVRDYGFTRMEADHCLYLVRRENGDFILVLLFVDDLALASNSRKMLDGFKKSLMEKFEMKDLGELRWFLGMRITRDRERRTLGIDQSQYIEKMVSNYQLPTSTADMMEKVKSPKSTKVSSVPSCTPCVALVLTLHTASPLCLDSTAIPPPSITTPQSEFSSTSKGRRILGSCTGPKSQTPF